MANVQKLSPFSQRSARFLKASFDLNKVFFSSVAAYLLTSHWYGSIKLAIGKCRLPAPRKSFNRPVHHCPWSPFKSVWRNYRTAPKQ